MICRSAFDRRGRDIGASMPAGLALRPVAQLRQRQARPAARDFQRRHHHDAAAAATGKPQFHFPADHVGNLGRLHAGSIAAGPARHQTEEQ